MEPRRGDNIVEKTHAFGKQEPRRGDIIVKKMDGI